jgi:hypothetical protein
MGGPYAAFSHHMTYSTKHRVHTILPMKGVLPPHNEFPT